MAGEGTRPTISLGSFARLRMTAGGLALNSQPSALSSQLRRLRQAPQRHIAQDSFLVVRAADDFLEGGDEFLLVVDQAAQGRQPAGAHELAGVPLVLGEE